MTWNTPNGERILLGAEAALMRAAIAHLVDVIQNEIEGIMEPGEFGIPVFDALPPNARLAVLAEVGTGLLCRSKSCPPLTAINESMIAAIFHHLSEWIQYELDMEDDADEEDEEDDDDPCYWRELALAVYAEFENEDLPDRTCCDSDVWDLIVDGLSNRILWDNDFNTGTVFLDSGPQQSKEMRDRLGVDKNYHLAIPPDPKDAEIPAILAKLRALCGE